MTAAITEIEAPASVASVRSLQHTLRISSLPWRNTTHPETVVTSVSFDRSQRPAICSQLSSEGAM